MMEEIAEINFIAALEGQEIERTMTKIVSIQNISSFRRESSHSNAKQSGKNLIEHPNVDFTSTNL